MHFEITIKADEGMYRWGAASGMPAAACSSASSMRQGCTA